MNTLLKIKNIRNLYTKGYILSVVGISSYAFVSGFNNNDTFADKIMVSCLATLVFGGAIIATEVAWPLTAPIAVATIYNMNQE